jgi:periplasmic protein TonB
MAGQMFASSSMSTSNPQRTKRRVVALVLAVLVNVFLVTTAVLGPLFATNVLPEIYNDLTYVIRADIYLPPPPPPTPPVVETEKKVPTDIPNPKAAPFEPPDKVTEEVVNPPKWSPPTECLTCVPGGTDPPTTGLPPVVGLPLPPSPPPQKPLLVSDSQTPKPIVRINPIYPEIARSARTEGVVIIEAEIDIHGNVVNAKILRGNPLLNEAALSAVRQWKYVPHKLNGVPVPIIITVTVNFTLR